ncbi:hypothetical protein Dimus_004696 [Dionaea muscipula]
MKRSYVTCSKNVAILCVLIAGVALLSLWNPTASGSFRFSQCFSPSSSYNHDDQNHVSAGRPKHDELEAALEKVSISIEGSKIVVITVVNKAYAEGEMLDLFLESFWVGEGTRELIQHLLVVAVDQVAYERCLFRGLRCYRLEQGEEDVDFRGEKVFMSDEFIEMMWRRTLFLLRVLKNGYSFIFTDTDVMWLRNPFKVLINEAAADIQFSTDRYNGNPKSELNPLNTGFYYVRSNNRTVALFEKWYGQKDSSRGHKEQDVLQNLVRSGSLRELNITASFLDTNRFSGFCQNSNDFRSVITVHSNCCRFISAKVADLNRVLVDWTKFKESPPNDTSSLHWSPHVNCVGSWRH